MMAMLMIWVPCAPTLALLSSEAQEASTHSDNQDKQHDKDKVEVTQLNEAVIPAYKIDMVFFVCFIQELGLLEEVPEVKVLDTPLPHGTYLQTLFRRIISPNAP